MICVNGQIIITGFSRFKIVNLPYSVAFRGFECPPTISVDRNTQGALVPRSCYGLLFLKYFQRVGHLILFITIILCFEMVFPRCSVDVYLLQSVADLRGDAPGAPPPRTDQNFFNFIGFSETLLKC